MTRSGSPADSWHALKRAAALGIVAAVLTGLGGRVLERARFGPTDEESLARIERELRQRFDASAAALAALTSQVSTSADLIHLAASNKTAAQRLFNTLDAALQDGRTASTGLTVYDSTASPVAWSGHVSDHERQRIDGATALFVAPGAFGPALVRIEPVMDRARPTSTRVGTIVAEQLIGEPFGAPDAGRFVFPGSLVPIALRASLSLGSTPAPHSFAIASSGGALLVEAHVDPRDVAAARATWRVRTRAAVYGVLALTLLCAAPFVDVWRRAASRRQMLAAIAALLVLLGGACLLLRLAARAFAPGLSQPAIELLLSALLMTALVSLVFQAIERWRIAPPRRRLLSDGDAAMRRLVAAYVVAGALDLTLLWSYERFLQRVASHATLDLLRFSLTPPGVGRIAMMFGLVLVHASVIWSAALVIRIAALAWRTPRRTSWRIVAGASWTGGVAAALLVARRLPATAPPLEYGPLLVALLAAAAGAMILARPRGPVRKASQAARLFGLYVALLAPSIAMYPSLHAFAVQAKERIVAETFGPQAASIREELQRQLNQALAQIDAMPGVPALLEGPAGSDQPTIDQAFAVWDNTTLKDSRLTSAVELYAADGALVSRFALNLPQYGAFPHMATGCDTWDVIEEASNVLRAGRGVCSGSQSLGAVVVRVMLDYRTLPFISSASPYLESIRPEDLVAAEDAPGHDIEFAVYGWSRAPLYMAGTAVWQLPDLVFDRMVNSRQPFWETVRRGAEAFRVYFQNDRGGIYALGYPIITPLGHLMNLAELVVLAGALYVLLLTGAALFNAVAPSRPATGRALLREVRSSFYRKLFLAFVAVAVLPAIILAVATRNRLVGQFGDSVNESAVKTATVAQRLVEDYATLQQRGARALGSLDDQIMMLVERAIAQDVNLFDRTTLQATSERDLFASGLFPRRTPADVYRSVALDRMPTFVSIEEVGRLRYLLAAAPVRAGGSERIVTIPMTLRQRDLDRQRDDLDRRVWSAFVLFVLLGGGLGYWTAERIADPVNRLTRATRRIARGDLDARIAATSSDELGRLVDDFNRMAADLKRQRSELERTQRLEAWADMARQVAHEIKNPLTPIQLSAEHALRINLDRGRPLSPVLDDCVNAILGQVKLLRQISAEFSSFASSPTVRPEMTDLGTLIDEVVEPYATGLSGRIAIEVHAERGLPSLTLDRTLFARALTNVIENAIHAMPGQGRLTITAALDEADAGGAAARVARTVIVTIADTGVGMDQDALARIFEPYFSTRASGTGLGLTIAKRNVELIGGKIRVDSQRGIGTTVTITIAIDRETGAWSGHVV